MKKDLLVRIRKVALVLACVLSASSLVLPSAAVGQTPPAADVTHAGAPKAASDRHPLVDVRFHRQAPAPPAVAFPGTAGLTAVAVDPATRTAYVGDAEGIN